MQNVYVNQFNTFSSRNLLPLAAGLLVSLIRDDPDLNKDFRTFIQIQRKDPQDTLQDYRDPFLMAFSAYLWNIQHSLAVACLVKEKYPQCLIVFGGPSTPYREEAAARFLKKNPFIDVLVHGEGEFIFGFLLKAWQGQDGFRTIPGITYRTDEDDKGYIRQPLGQRIENLDRLPSPFLNGVFDEVLKRNRSEITGTVWETSRGCPFSCSFCDWGCLDDKRVLLFGKERLFKELDWISRNLIGYVFAADANFGLMERDLEIVRYMGHLCRITGFPNYIQVNWLKNSHRRVLEMADVFKASKMGFMITLSMQTLSDPALVAIRRKNIDLETYSALKAEYNQRGVDTYCEFMLGLPGETYDSFTEGLLKVLSPFPRDHFALYLTVVLPNAEMARPEYRTRHGIVTRFCEASMCRRRIVSRTVREIEEIVVATGTMPLADWCRAYRFGYLLRALHNLRIGFFVLEFLREQYRLSLKEIIEYVIRYGADTDTPFLQQALGVFDHYIHSILNNDKSVLSMEDYPDYYWEPHEMFFLYACRGPQGFYQDFKKLTRQFLKGKNIAIDETLLDDIFRYQEGFSPLNKNQEPFSLPLRHDLAAYFMAVMNNQTQIKIEKQDLLLECTSARAQYQGKGEYPVAAVRMGASSSVPLSRIDKINKRRIQK